MTAAPYVAATVVRAGRPASVRPGATARVLGDGTIDGFVGGVCAEESVRLHALRALETGEALLLRIEPGGGESPAVVDGAVTVHNPCLSGGALEIFLEPRLPPPRVRVVGDTPIGAALRSLAGALGYEVGDSAGADDAAVVVASHGRDEEPALEAALEAGVPYVGLVASRRRGEAVLASLGADAERVHTPAGLDIGARTPQEIALSILAEIVATRRTKVTAPAGDEHHEGHCCHE
jgi:xanthine dehydrogenase accessory factor